MAYFFEKNKIIYKKLFSGHFITKKNPTSKWTFFFVIKWPEKDFLKMILIFFQKKIKI